MGDFYEISNRKDLLIKMRLTNMMKKQIPYPYTNTAMLMSYDWGFIFKRSWFARLAVISTLGFGVPAFFAMGKLKSLSMTNAKQKPKDIKASLFPFCFSSSDTEMSILF